MKNLTPSFSPEERELNARLLAALPPLSSIRPRARIVDYEIVELATKFRAGELQSIAVTLAYLDRITQFNGAFETYDENGGYNAFVRIDRDAAVAQALLADQWLQNPDDERGPAPPLCGIPIGVKDSIGIQGRESKNGTHAFSTNFALQDATCVARLRAQGAVLIGQTVCSEFSGDVLGQFAGNAWDPSRVPGGSSQGSAVAPMARLAAAALGEETAGSIIFPAAANGVSAIKPSLGLVSGAGVMPLRVGYDVVGPMARSMCDASLMLSIMLGVDQQNDPQTLSAPIPPPILPITSRPDPKPLQGLTIGIPQTDWMTGPLMPPAVSYDADYKEAFTRFKEELRLMGAEVIDFPWLDAYLEENSPYLSPYAIHEVVDEEGQTLLRVNPQLATTFTNQVETRYWLAIRDFANSLSNEEHRDQLLQHYGPDRLHSSAGLIPVHIKILAENLRRQQQMLFEQALDRYGIDFMMVLPIGAHIGLRFDEIIGNEMPVRRAFHDLPNALTWPMITFPIGHGQTNLPYELPITAAFWGRRFSEPLLVQAAIDFQNRFSQYHTKAPPDPTFGPGTQRPSHIPRVRDLPPEYSTDPLAIAQARGRRS